MSEEPQSAGVIGGGVAGLTAAYRLLQKGCRVRLFEAGPVPKQAATPSSASTTTC